MLLKAQGLYVFGPYRLDAHERQLLRDGASVRLPPKAFDMLVALVARAGSLATKEELLSEVWPGTFVEEANLSFTISVVRKALGEHERYIETVPKSGYRFIAPVSVLSAVVGAEPSPPGSIGAQTAKHWNWRRVGVLIGAGLLAISAWQSNFTRRPITTEVADTYFQAMYHRLRWQDGGCARAVPLFERVVTLEPEFDEAYAHLAWCYAYPDRTGQSVAVIEPKATTAAETALRLNPDLARGHAVLGLIKWRLGYDWSLAEKKYRRAINLNPRDSQTLIEFGEYLYASGHLKEGVETVDRGLALDRFRLDSNVAFGFALYLTRQYDNAIAQLRTTLDLDSHWANAQFWLAETRAIQGRHDEAVNEYLTWLRLVLVPGRVGATTEELANVYHRRGWRAFWQKEIDLAEEERQKPGTVWRLPYGRYSGSFFMARRYARLGDRDKTMASLEAAYFQRHHLIVFLRREPLFDQFDADPKFRDLARRVGIP